MIVRDAGDSWQIVLQTDHGKLAGEFAAGWGSDGFAAPAPRDSVVTVSARHDDSWCSWERAPRRDPESGKPVTFTEVWVPTHLAFYRGGIAVLLEVDRYAAMLLSMHAAGIYTGRYGTQPSLTQRFAGEARKEIDAFVAEREEEFGGLASSLGVGDREQWTNYKLLQVFDRLSLYFAMNDVESGTPFTIAPAPRGYDGDGEAELTIEPDGPWRIRVDPYPFRERPASFTLRRRLVPKREWADDDAFRADFSAAEVETVTLTLT